LGNYAWLHCATLLFDTIIIECVAIVFGYNANRMTLLIMNFLMTQGDLQKKDLDSKLVCFGANGLNTFQGFRSQMTFQIQCQYVPFVIGVHCMAHWTNKPSQTYLWFFTLKICCNVYMVILVIAPKNIWSLPN
jgi:hypothetical protein